MRTRLLLAFADVEHGAAINLSKRGWPGGLSLEARSLGAVKVDLIEPMLATAGQPSTGHEWAVEPKLDGWRALVYVDRGVCVRTRRGRIITESVPELEKLADAVPDGTVLDGELVSGAGRSADFYRLGPQMARRRRPPVGVTLAVFDVLRVAGEPTITLTWAQRRRLLELLDLQGAGWCTVPTFDADADVVLAVAAEHKVEGVVLKRVDSTYEPGKRSRSWLKVKTADWREHHAPMRHER